MAQTIEAVLFDFGGVFTESPFGVMDAVGARHGVDSQQIRSIVFGPYDRDTDHAWHRLERGELSFADAHSEIVREAESIGLVGFDPLKALAEMRVDGGVRDPMVSRVRSLLAAGFRTALVTNNVREFRKGWRSLIPVEELFELVIDSSEVGVRKPDPEIFRIALQRLGDLVPEQALFLDDYEGNVEAARRIGLSAVRVDPNPSAALETLDRLIEG